MVRGSDDLVFDPILGVKNSQDGQGVIGNLVPDPMGGTSCGMVIGPTGLASNLSEVSLCAHRERFELC